MHIFNYIVDIILLKLGLKNRKFSYSNSNFIIGILLNFNCFIKSIKVKTSLEILIKRLLIVLFDYKVLKLFLEKIFDNITKILYFRTEFL